MVELSDDSDDDKDKAASIQGAKKKKNKVNPQQEIQSLSDEEVRKRFKEGVIELLKMYPGGIKTTKLITSFQRKYKWGPTKKQLNQDKKVLDVLYCDDFAKDITIDGNYVRLKSDQGHDIGITYNQLSWGKGAVALGEGLSKKGVGLRSSAAANVIDLTGDDERGEVKAQRGQGFVDLTHDQGRSGFISFSSQPMNQNTGNFRSGDSLLNKVIDYNKSARFGVKRISTEKFEQKEIRIAPVRLNPYQGAREAQLESVARECIELLSNANEFVSEERIGQLLLQRIGLRHIGEAHCQVRYANQIRCVNEHLRLLSKVNANIDGFMRIRCISTLYELQECLTELSPNKKDFSLLNIGPIQRLPLVYKFFKFPHDIAEIPEITTMDILDNLKGYMDKYNKWTGRLDMEDFLNYMVEKYHVENAYILGVRIRSLPLAAQVTFTLYTVKSLSPCNALRY